MHNNSSSDYPVVVNQSTPFVPAHGGPQALGPLVGFDTPAHAAVPLSHYLWILRRHCWKILGFVGACIAVTLIVSLRMTPVYQATATIDIDRQTPSGVFGQEMNRMVMTPHDADHFLGTQVKLLQSDSVLRPVAEQYKLLQREPGASIDPADPAYMARREAPVTLGSLRVARAPNTYLLLVSYRSPDPKLAANVANAVAQSYIQHTFNLRQRASSNLSSFMERQVDELKVRMERSTAALAQLEKELNVINPEEKTSILSARLLQLNTEYTHAQGDRVRK